MAMVGEEVDGALEMHDFLCRMMSWSRAARRTRRDTIRADRKGARRYRARGMGGRGEAADGTIGEPMNMEDRAREKKRKGKGKGNRKVKEME